ncbi:hypothetical protein MMG00_05795 [Ignatzschineria rhizosphaerae]|uniref:Uncharacterized protein n=1 Tax=Ignatzschineria rhizosphaerae TaxID=2923279 RepID=A0ABY3X3A2_9GAMM|nr:hypothetical protein [Ignatzschineria rhizosphaerae]UNM97358.1 hypothetical protein MMG00_05795 [Ignatzschineria rhizosphaerae]
MTRWNDLSVAAKEILRNKEPINFSNTPPALELLSQISQLTSQDTTQKQLIVTYHISDAIFVQMFLQEANPDLTIEAILPHKINTDIALDTNIIIAPFSLFLVNEACHEKMPLTEFDTITFDQKVAPEFLTQYLMDHESYKTLFNEDHKALILFTDFQSITSAISPVEAVNPLETIKPKGAKISLGKSQEKAKQKENVQEDVTEKTEKELKALKDSKKKVEATDKKDEEASIKEPAKKATTKKDQNQSIEDEKAIETADPSAFIAVVARNVQRQYIRDYIREHNLQHVLIVTHNRQSARLLEKYLYRARIRSRVVHEKIDDETATSLFDRYNDGQFTAMILMHRVVEELAAKIQKCDAVIFLDFPTVYSEYAERLNFVQTNFKPQHFISISTENDRAWVQALLEEYPDLNLPIEEIDIKPPKKRDNKPKPKHDKAQTVEAENISETPDATAVEETSPQESENEKEDNPRDRRNNRRNQGRQNRNDQRNERNNDRRDNKPRNNRRRQEQAANSSQNEGNQEFGDSQSDFFSANQDEIVNHNRLPFEAGSFEANIARENRRRGRDAFNTPGGIGQSTNGNFLQNITQGFNQNGNSNSQPQNRRSNSSNNNNNNRNRPRKNNRKK